MWTSVALCFLIVHARAEGWDDFTNNLATDLAPLIALFGEQATKQFLSESTSRIDNIIFAVAPLGILTAVVSVIRVLGSASLRAFVGRAQEGRGQAEAELCSSTSYDVCELWNNGGIARVFGRPRILEFVFDEREVPEHTRREDIEKSTKGISPLFYEHFKDEKVVNRPSAGIYRPQEYGQVFKLSKRTPPQGQAYNGDAAHTEFAPNPNLSLNIGIKKPSRIVLCGAAIFGCLLQTSVICYGAWAIYIKGLRKEGQSTVDPYFWLTVTGTLLLVAGMFLCAWLIEQSTQERTFTLGKQVFWLQPGNQTVGDQTFEAFAYSSKVEKYTTSWKEEGREGILWRKRVFVWLAIFTSMIGFVLQFTGLRGLHSSVAMYQFVATLIMALIRSLLRTQRLKESENLLRARGAQSQVEGHELDWQALRIESTLQNVAKRSLPSDNSSLLDPSDDPASDDELCWSIIEGPPKLEEAVIAGFRTELVNRAHAHYKATLIVHEDSSVACTSSLETGAENQDEWDGKCANALIEWIVRLESKDPANASVPQPPNFAKKLLCYRSRLSYLANDDAPTMTQLWGSTVREQAIKLQVAIQSVANYVFSDARQATIRAEWGTTAALCWAMNCDTACRPPVTAFPVHLMVRRVRGQWRIDICQLEAVLGLWTWSIMMKVEKHKKDERRYNEEVRAQEKKDNNSTSGKRGVKLNEHIEVGAEFQYEQMAKDKNEEARRKMETDCDLILSRKIFTVVSTESLQERQRAERELSIWIFREQRKPLYEDLDNDVLVGSGRSERACKAAPTLSLPMASKLLPRPNTEQQQDQHRKEMGLVSVQTENSVLVMAAQDIFTSFIDALASITSELKGISIVQSLRSDIVAEEVVAVSRPRPFLGLAHNHTERLADLFIQAGLGSRDDALLSVITPFHSRSLLPPLMKEYEQLKSQARNLRADGNWEQAENLLMALFDELEGKHPDGDTSSRSEELLKELGELYRKAMRSTDHSHRSFGYRGVRTMLKMRAEETNKTKEIRQNYGWVALELAKLHKDVDKVLTELQIEAKKDVGLVNAEITLQGTMQSESAYPIGLFMAEKFKKQIERETQSVRTQLLIWAAQKGCKELVEDLLCAGLDVNVHDEKRRTPLSYACERGYDDVSEYLLNKGATNTADEETHTPFTWAVKQGRCRVVQQFLTMNIDIELKDKEHERTPLSWAAEYGHDGVIKLLLNTGKVDVESRDKNYGQTPLSWAAEHGHNAVVKLLLNTGNVNVNSKDKDERTPLLQATANRHEAVVKLLLDTGKVDVNSEDKDGWTPLLQATKNGYDAVVKLLLDTGKVDVESKDKNYEQTPLSWAAEYGHDAIVKLLLDTGKVDVESKDRNGQTPLSWAALRGHRAVFELLLNTGNVNVNSEDKDGRTPLLQAAENGYEAVVKLLLDTGKVDVNSEDKDGRTPLLQATKNGHDTIVELLLDNGNVNINSKDKDGRTPLSRAAEHGYEAVVKLLLATGKVDVDLEDNLRRTPLFWAAKHGFEEVVGLLLDTGEVNVDLKDFEGRTPLSWAAERGDEAIVKLLLGTSKIDVDLENNLRRTPLSLAAIYGHEAVVKLLLDTGKVDIESKDITGRTPLSWASKHGHEAVAKLLKGE